MKKPSAYPRGTTTQGVPSFAAKTTAKLPLEQQSQLQDEARALGRAVAPECQVPTVRLPRVDNPKSRPRAWENLGPLVRWALLLVALSLLGWELHALRLSVQLYLQESSSLLISGRSSSR